MYQTRSHLRKIAALALALVFAISLLPTALMAETGTVAVPEDLQQVSPEARDAVLKLWEHGIVKGKDGKNVNPKGTWTRLEMAVIMSVALGLDTLDVKINDTFKDLDKISAGMAAHANRSEYFGVFNGDGKGNFMPDKVIRPIEVLGAIGNVLRLENVPLDTESRFNLNGLVDWEKQIVLNAEAGGLLDGFSDDFNLAGITNRETAMIFVAAMMGEIIDSNADLADVTTERATVRKPNVRVKNLKAESLLVTQGVGTGDLWLEECDVADLTVRGGGKDSIHIIGTKVGALKIEAAQNGSIRIVSEDGSTVEFVYVNDGSDDIVLEGKYESVEITGNVTVQLQNAEVASVAINGAEATLVVNVGASVDAISVKAEDVTVIIKGTAETITVEGTGASVNAEAGAEIGKIEVKANDTSITTADDVTANIVVDKDVTGTTVGDEAVNGGETVKTGDDTPATTPPASGGGGGGGGADPVIEYRVTSASVTGIAKVGLTLTASVTQSVPGTVTYQWQQADTANATTWTNITGATSATYVVAAGLAGKYIRVGAKGASDTTATNSAAVGPVAAADPTGPSADELAAEAFESDHATPLSLKVASISSMSDVTTYKAGVFAALADYENLSAGAKTILSAQKTLLDNLKVKIEDVEAAADAQIEANAFTTTYSTILGKATKSSLSVTDTTDENAVTNALAAYGMLSTAAKGLLTSQKALLDNQVTWIAELKVAKIVSDFKTTHATALAKTVDSTNAVAVGDRGIVEAALSAYNGLSAEAKAGLTTENALLVNLLAQIVVLENVEIDADAVVAIVEALELYEGNVAIAHRSETYVASSEEFFIYYVASKDRNSSNKLNLGIPTGWKLTGGAAITDGALVAPAATSDSVWTDVSLTYTLGSGTQTFTVKLLPVADVTFTVTGDNGGSDKADLDFTSVANDTGITGDADGKHIIYDVGDQVALTITLGSSNIALVTLTTDGVNTVQTVTATGRWFFTAASKVYAVKVEIVDGDTLATAIENLHDYSLSVADDYLNLLKAAGLTVIDDNAAEYLEAKADIAQAIKDYSVSEDAIEAAEIAAILDAIQAIIDEIDEGAAVDSFLSDYADVLLLVDATVEANDRTDVEEALAAYIALSDDAKAAVDEDQSTSVQTLLEGLLAEIALIEAADAAANALTAAVADLTDWAKIKAANDKLKAAQDAAGVLAGIQPDNDAGIDAIKTAIGDKIRLENFTTLGGDAGLAGHFNGTGSDVTTYIYYVNSLLTTAGKLTVNLPTGWTAKQFTVGGTEREDDTIIYNVGNDDEVEYTLTFDPVAKFEVTFLTGVTGTITINDGSPDEASRTTSGNVIALINDEITVATADSSLLLTVAVKNGALINGSFAATSQVYTVTVSNKPLTATPEVLSNHATLSSLTQTSINFTLTNTHTGTWKVYDSSGASTVSNNVKVSVTGTTLTLTATGTSLLAAGTYYVTLTETGKLESAKLALTVADMPTTATPTASVTTVAKTAATQKDVVFTLTAPVPAPATGWKVYATATATSVITGVTAAGSGTDGKLTLSSTGADLAATTYYVSLTTANHKESGRLALTVGENAPSITTLVGPYTKVATAAEAAAGTTTKFYSNGTSLTVNGAVYTVSGDMQKILNALKTDDTVTFASGAITNFAIAAGNKNDGAKTYSFAGANITGLLASGSEFYFGTSSFLYNAVTVNVTSGNARIAITYGAGPYTNINIKSGEVTVSGTPNATTSIFAETGYGNLILDASGFNTSTNSKVNIYKPTQNGTPPADGTSVVTMKANNPFVPQVGAAYEIDVNGTKYYTNASGATSTSISTSATLTSAPASILGSATANYTVTAQAKSFYTATPPVTTTYSVTVTSLLDDEVSAWAAAPNYTYILKKSDTTVATATSVSGVATIANVAADTYDIFYKLASGTEADTNVNVTVGTANASANVNFYTVTFANETTGTGTTSTVTASTTSIASLTTGDTVLKGTTVTFAVALEAATDAIKWNNAAQSTTASITVTYDAKDDTVYTCELTEDSGGPVVEEPVASHTSLVDDVLATLEAYTTASHTGLVATEDDDLIEALEAIEATATSLDITLSVPDVDSANVNAYANALNTLLEDGSGTALKTFASASSMTPAIAKAAAKQILELVGTVNEMIEAQDTLVNAIGQSSWTSGTHAAATSNYGDAADYDEIDLELLETALGETEYAALSVGTEGYETVLLHAILAASKAADWDELKTDIATAFANEVGITTMAKGNPWNTIPTGTSLGIGELTDGSFNISTNTITVTITATTSSLVEHSLYGAGTGPAPSNSTYVLYGGWDATYTSTSITSSADHTFVFQKRPEFDGVDSYYSEENNTGRGLNYNDVSTWGTVPLLRVYTDVGYCTVNGGTATFDSSEAGDYYYIQLFLAADGSVLGYSVVIMAIVVQ